MAGLPKQWIYGDEKGTEDQWAHALWPDGLEVGKGMWEGAASELWGKPGECGVRMTKWRSGEIFIC